MNRRGFALLTVLWAVTVLTVLAGAAMLVSRFGNRTTRNRVLLARAEWARDACAEILLARFAADSSIRLIDTTDLGHGTWCRVRLDDPSAKVNVNTASHDLIARLFTVIGVRSAIVDSIAAARHRGPIYDLSQVAGIDSLVSAKLAPFMTTRGSGLVNLNVAPLEVLMVLPGMSEESASQVLSRRGIGPFQIVDEVVAALGVEARDQLLESYDAFARIAVFSPPQWIAIVEGGVRATPLVARATLTTTPVPGRLAIIRRETE